MRRSHIRRDFGHDFLLGRGEIERQGVFDFFPEVTSPWTRKATRVFHPAAPIGQLKLNPKKDITHELDPRHLRFLQTLGKVDRAPDIERQRVGIGRIWPQTGNGGEIGHIQGAVDIFPQDLHWNPISGGVHGRNAVKVDRGFGVILDHLELGMLHDDLAGT